MTKEYRTNGSVAYDMYVQGETAARPLRQPKRLPDAKVFFPPVKKTKMKLKISPLAVIGAAVAALLLLLVVHHHARLYEARMELAQLEQTYEQLLQEQQSLTAQYEAALDMEAVEARARALGMTEPDASQIVYVQVERP